jgi:hypothetical protein
MGEALTGPQLSLDFADGCVNWLKSCRESLSHPDTPRQGGRVPQKGIEKQVPADQRGRGMNPEHPEGQANRRNQEHQGAKAPPPQPKKGK